MNRGKIVPFLTRRAALKFACTVASLLAVSGFLFIALKGKSVSAQDRPRTGFISIEAARDADTTGATGEFTFTISHSTGGFSRVVAVTAGASSLAIEVPAGTLTITEEARSGLEVSGVTAASGGGENRLVGTPNLSARTATVTVVAGDVSTQTLVRFINRAASPRTGTT